MSDGNAMVPATNWASAARDFGDAQDQRLIKQVFACFTCSYEEDRNDPPAVVVMVNGTTYCVDHAVPIR